MSAAKKIAGSVLATAAAAIFAGCAHTSADEAKMEKAEVAQVKCTGTNSCKGTSECATANSACKGQNSCSGQGWVYADSAESCTSDGGTVAS